MSTCDIYLNDLACEWNVSADGWNHRPGGCQVMKEWLSYREREGLGWALRVREVRYFSEVLRRIGRILMTTQ